MYHLSKFHGLQWLALVLGILLLFGGLPSEHTVGQSTIEREEAIYPAQVLNLINWKLTLPIDLNGDGKADEIKQPQLQTYKHEEYFYVSAGKNSVIFRCPTQGATTPGSNYCRTELREMSDNGRSKAAWNSSTGRHVLSVALKVNQLPEKKPSIAVAQILHNHNVPVYMIKINKNLIYVQNHINALYRGSLNLDENYILGTPFSIRFVVYDDKTEVYYNDVLKSVLEAKFSNAYFKTGCYSQSDESPTSYGSVEIFNIQLHHSYYSVYLPFLIKDN